MAKSEKYYFDLDSVRLSPKQVTIDRMNRAVSENNKWVGGADGQTPHNLSQPRSKRTGTKYIGERITGWTGDKSTEGHPLGANPGSVSDFWDIPTKPSSDEHFAAYNESLIGTPIVAGCPELICNKCGKPREKVIEKTPMVIDRSERRSKMGQPEGTAASGTMVTPPTGKFIGYSDCGCNAGFYKGVILDPFCGTATTGCRALELGRNFIGFEGSEKFVKMGQKNLEPYIQQQQLF